MNSTHTISTHVLDLVHGRPAVGMPVLLEHLDGEWHTVVAGHTDSDGRVKELVPEGQGRPGIHRITFETGAWFATQGTASFYPVVQIVFTLAADAGHSHVPLLLGPYGYSTYRGS